MASFIRIVIAIAVIELAPGPAALADAQVQS